MAEKKLIFYMEVFPNVTSRYVTLTTLVSVVIREPDTMTSQGEEPLAALDVTLSFAGVAEVKKEIHYINLLFALKWETSVFI